MTKPDNSDFVAQKTLRLCGDAAAHYTSRTAIKLVLAMPVETFIKTAGRAVASYFIKPLFDQAKRTFHGG